MFNRIRRSRFAQDVLPLLTSLGVHAFIILAGIAALRALVTPAARGPAEAQAVAPDMHLVAAAELPDRPPLAELGRGERIDEPAGFSREEALLATPPAGESLTDAGAIRPDDAAREADAAAPIIGGSQADFRADAFGDRPAGRPGTPFGLPAGIGGGRGLGGAMFKVARPVRSVVFVCDASGSMLDKFSSLKQQLNLSVASLKPIQSFNVIFFKDGGLNALSAGDLLPAVDKNKRTAERFLDDAIPAGTTNPLPALELALRQQPELIWLLTDGDFPDNEAVLALLRARNRAGRVKVNTIAFGERGDSYEKVLRAIASENGGEFRYVAGDRQE